MSSGKQYIEAAPKVNLEDQYACYGRLWQKVGFNIIQEIG